MGKPSWICCQIGAREHYMVARALQSQNALRLLVTDLWSNPGALIASLPVPQLNGRFHPDLSRAPVAAWNLRSFSFEAAARFRHAGWQRILERNNWFQRRAVDALRSYRKANQTQRT